MFSEQTEREVANAIGQQASGMPVTLSNWAYRELLEAARRWDAAMSGPAASSGAWIGFTPQRDGSVTINPVGVPVAGKTSGGGSN